MSIIRINAITVPEGRGSEIEDRFASRVGEVEEMPGFEGFQLLRPVAGDYRYFVVTRWESEQAFRNWVESDAFRKSHARTAGNPVATHAELLAFDIVLEAKPRASTVSQ